MQEILEVGTQYRQFSLGYFRIRKNSYISMEESTYTFCSIHATAQPRFLCSVYVHTTFAFMIKGYCQFTLLGTEASNIHIGSTSSIVPVVFFHIISKKQTRPWGQVQGRSIQRCRRTK